MRTSVLAVVVLLSVAACGDAADNGADAAADNGAAADPMADRANAIAATDLATFTADPE